MTPVKVMTLETQLGSARTAGVYKSQFSGQCNKVEMVQFTPQYK